MCGITGFFAYSAEAVPTLSKITQSTQKLFFRGPDSGNVYKDGKTALGHRRLSIIDTSTGASQPMTDQSGRYVLIFNGEIFNYQELSLGRLAQVWEKNGGPRPLPIPKCFYISL